MTVDEKKIVRDSNVIRYRDENLTVLQISKKLDIPRTTVYNILKKYDKYGTVMRLKGSGRKKSLDNRDIAIILSEIDKNPFISSETIKNEIEKGTEKDVTSRTVRNYIRKTSFRSRIPRKVPYLSKKNINRRIELANEWSSYENEDWDKIIWSDETKINLFSSDGRKRCYRKANSALELKNCLPTIKHGGGSIMVWGCMSSKGCGNLVIIRGTMDKYVYKTILTKNLRASAIKLGLEEDFIFQQDNDPKHTSQYVSDYFVKKDINLLDWPSQSPDLNPIEHLWDHIKCEVRKKKPKNIKELEKYVIEIWNSIDPEVCKKIVRTMYDRASEVLKSKGGHIPY